MSAYELARVIEKWDREELTNEQAIGQLLLLVESLNRRVGSLERRIERLRGVKEVGSQPQAEEQAAAPPLLQRSASEPEENPNPAGGGPAGGAVFRRLVELPQAG